MKKSPLSKLLAMLLSVVMLVGVLPMSAMAAGIYENSTYYNVISEKSWDLAPGIQETEVVLNNDAGTRRQVLHTAIVDLNNEYVKVIPGTKGMAPDENGNWPNGIGTQSTSVQALEAEQLGYGNVVVATNASLSWYTEAYYKENPHLIGEPLGYSILDGQLYANSRWVEGKNNGGVQTITVINYDYHPLTGEKRPDDMPKVWIRSALDPLTGWEEQAIPVLFTYLVKPDANGNPVNQYKEDHGTGIASRTFVGVRADGTLVLAVSDGEQAPYSTGFTSYEMAEYMIEMGCVIAANCDGGGSTTFCSQRPGEDLKVNCSLSDGGERPTSNTFLVISTAPANGIFARATISSEYDYYTPGSSVEFTALGTDAVGTKVEIPSDVEWTIKEENMGTIANGVFTSNGTEGTVTAQMIYDGSVVGERTITIATPDTLSFDQPVITIPFGKTAAIPVKATATINGVQHEIGLGANDVTFTTTNEAMGTFSGLSFTAVDEANAPADLTSTVTATLNMGTNPTATVQLSLGKGSVVLWDFEDGQADIDEWNVINNRKNAAHWDYDLNLSLATAEDGQVHDGNYSMRLETNGLSSKDSHSEQYAWIRMGVDGEAITLENARSVGFWLYVPEDNIQCWVQGHYKTDSNGDGVFDTDNVVSMMESENVYYNIDESGWHYLSMDISAFEKVALQADKQYDKDPSDGMTGDKGEFFLALVFHKAINNKLWQENGSINGPYTYYLDNFTVDYSDAVEDRENPVFDKIYMNGTALVKRDVVTTTNNNLTLSAAVADQSVRLDANKNEVPLYNVSGLNAASAKIYIDGCELNEISFSNGTMSANVNVADGYHRVKFEICDNAGNKSVMIRVIKVESDVDASTIKVVPDNPDLDRIPFGSVYWMNLVATDIETIQEVITEIDLNNVNHWQLDNMVLADGFSAEYSINKETNTAAITFTRNGNSTQTGEAVLAKLPVRIVYFDTDIKTPGYTAETYWTAYPFWAQDMKMDVDVGYIEYTKGYSQNGMNTFSNEEFHVDTEMYTSMANMDKAYFTAHGTTHVHSPAAIDDQAPTCTQPGYTGRTFCEGCNSPVEWGTTIPAKGHEYKNVDGKMICDCGAEDSSSGLQTIDGKTYYMVNGTPIGGWVQIDDEWYYFDKTTFAGVDGEQYADKGVKFTFENGRLLSGTWVKTTNGMQYWYGPGYYRDTSPELTSSRPYEIDGKTYLFNRSGYMQTGVARFFNGGAPGKTGAGCFDYYDCGEDGAAVLLTGPYEDYFYVDGARQQAYQLVSYNGDYYFINDGHKLAKNTSLYLGAAFVDGKTFADGTPISVGKYEFDSDGKMIVNTPEIPDAPDTPDTPDTPPETVKNGVYGDYLYKDGVIVQRYQLVEFDGSFYFVNDGNKIAKNTKLYLNATYVSGKTFSDGTPIPAGLYEFNAEGKMVVKNGVYGDYLYKNGLVVKRYQLVEYDGSFYFVNDGDKIAKNTNLYLSERFVEGKTFADGTSIPAGLYHFNADGKMDIKKGVHGDYLYKNGLVVKRYQLAEYDGNFYFVNDGDKIAKNTKLYLSDRFVEGKTFADGTPIPAGTYEFDAEGKMVVKNGVYGDYLYKNGLVVKRYQLAEYDGNFYFINDGDKIARDIKIYLSSKFVEGKTYPDGSMVEVGYHYFNSEGKMEK